MIPFIKKIKNVQNLELETSVGYFEGGSFKSGVDFETFENLYRALSKTPYVKNLPERNIIDYFYRDGIRGRFTEKGSEFVVKKTLLSTAYEVRNSSRKVRVKLSSETPVEMIHEDPNKARLIKRWSFEYVDRGFVYRYDLSKTVEGESKEDACRKSPKFHVELEVIGDIRTLDYDLFLNRSLDLVGRFRSDGRRRVKQPAFGRVLKHFSRVT
jgi:hypothetical protein